VTTMHERASLFPLAEYHERLLRGQTALSDAGFVGAVCVSPETLFYLSGYEGYTFWTEQALVLSASGGEATLILRDTDLPLAVETAVVGDVRTYRFGREDPVQLVRDALYDLGLARGTIGTEKQSYALPAAYGERLTARLEDSFELGDCSRLLSRLRVRKSAAELACVRTAATYARSGTAAAVGAIRAGATEIEIAAAIERSLRHAGSDYSAMPTMVASGPRTAAVHSTPTTRVVGAGDQVVVWFAGVERRYHVTAYRTVQVGEPSTRFGEMYHAAESSLGVLIDNVAVGRPVAQAAQAASAHLRATDYSEHQIARWGYGVGIAFPPVWLEAFDVVEESEDVFEPGTLMCLHVCFSAPDEGVGLYVGGDYLLTESGLEALDDLGTGLIAV